MREYLRRVSVDSSCEESTAYETMRREYDANAGAGQKAFLHRARMNGLARDGKWTPDAEKAAG